MKVVGPLGPEWWRPLLYIPSHHVLFNLFIFILVVFDPRCSHPKYFRGILGTKVQFYTQKSLVTVNPRYSRQLMGVPM